MQESHRPIRRIGVIRTAFIFLILILGSLSAANGGVFSVLYYFQPSAGKSPDGTLIQSGTDLYGTTSFGGTYNQGAIYKFDLLTNTETTLYSFTGGSDGKNPFYGSLVKSGAMLYGTTESGGGSGFGEIYQIDTATNALSVAHSFAGGLDGTFINGSLIQSGSILYGMTESGGNSRDSGTVFSFDTAAQSNTTLYTFGTSGGHDAARPSANSLTHSGSDLYGVTDYGGTATGGGLGTIFKFDLQTSTETVLHSFGGAGDGANPNKGLIQSGSLFYGMTNAGGAHGLGMIFKFDSVSNTESILYSFVGGSDGAYPQSSVVQSGSMLYGMTNIGGAFNEGTIFQLDLSNNIETVLHSFSLDQGEYPRADLIISGNTLYGTASSGEVPVNGIYAGSLFSMTIPEPSSLGLMIGGGILLLRRRTRLPN
jgi:uncharacterized repeat protein (TIGR03803 family)